MARQYYNLLGAISPFKSEIKTTLNPIKMNGECTVMRYLEFNKWITLYLKWEILSII